MEESTAETSIRQHNCFNCGTGSDSRVLLACEFRGQVAWVCVRCLPMLIHSPMEEME